MMRMSSTGVDTIASLSRGGFLMDEDPQTYYKYALLDPLDHPFATFRYFDRSLGMSSHRILESLD